MTAAIRACGSWANTASSSGTFLSGLGINGWLGSGPDPETGWTTEFAEAEHLLRDIDMSLQERDFKQRRGADAAKITAAVRGKIAQVSGRLETLEMKILPSLQLSEAELNRKRDALARLKGKLEQLSMRVSASQAALDRAELLGDTDPVKAGMRATLGGGMGAFEGGARAQGGRSLGAPTSPDQASFSGRPPLPGGGGGLRGGGSGMGMHRSGSYAGPQRLALGGQPHKVHSETDITASLDTRQLLQHQNQALSDQDRLIQSLSAGVASLKRTSLAISEELDSQKEVVERLDYAVDKTRAQLGTCQKKATDIVGAPPPESSWASTLGVPSAVTGECSIM